MPSSVIQVKVRRKRTEAIDISAFELVPVSAEALPHYEPGAHIDVDVGGGQVRQYSLCTPYDGNCYVIGVKRDPKSRGGSLFMHTGVREGDVLNIGAPKNHFPLAPEGQRFILLAGGIGITPLLSMATQLLRAGKKVELHYFAQSMEHAAFRDRLQHGSLAESVTYHLGLGPGDLPGVLATILGAPEPLTYVYLCGPRPFMLLVQQAAASWPTRQVRFEYFGTDPASVPESTAAADAPFEVSAALSGVTVEVQPGESIVQVLRAHGVHVETSCEEGHCGTCLTEVLEGEPQHLDSFLTPAERASGDRILPCVSRSRSARLVLNL